MAATLSILTFPQKWAGNQLTIRVLIIPRNLDPTLADQIAMDTPAWCDSTIALQARIGKDPEAYPSILSPDVIFPLVNQAMPADVKGIFEEMAKQLGGIQPAKTLKIKPTQKLQVRKYLPESYRNSFNFTTPRTQDAAIDDSYHCAIKNKPDKDPSFKPSYDSLDWGKVFAYCLRQPALAEKAGFIYEKTFAVDPSVVKDGGWIYADLAAECSYFAAMSLDQLIVKRYAARIPKLEKNAERTLFAAVQFPVLLSAVPDPANEDDPVQPTAMDELLIEAEQYADGFCKIVHANQPVSSDLLREKEDKELPVITEAGIRLGWDDEQLLIWMNRQMKQATKSKGDEAPMGVMQYRVDVREHKDIDENDWTSLCKIRNDVAIKLADLTIDSAGLEKELGVEVYPAQLDPQDDKPYWLPHYFTNWIGNSLVLPDVDAIDIFQKEKNDIVDKHTGLAKQVKKSKYYSAAGLTNCHLKYGTRYDFRVRLADITGGGPDEKAKIVFAGPASEGFCDFRRRVQPQTVRIGNTLPEKDGEYFTDPSIKVQRPLLGYPSVLFTGQYPEAVKDLQADVVKVRNEDLRREIGLPDPDVAFVEVMVEIKALGMDLLLRGNKDSRDSYAKLYVTNREFPTAFDGKLEIPITYVDAPVLNFMGSKNLGELGLVNGGDDIDGHKDIVLPTSRDIRITLRPVLADIPDYYPVNSDLWKIGKPLTFITRKGCKKETDLFKFASGVDIIRGIWLQPDTDTYLKAKLGEIFVENYLPSNTSSLMERLADAIDKSIPIEAKGLSLIGKKGARLQFGISRFIRHNMSPDSTNVTFATKGDLLNHWIVPITLMLNRDWTWDGVAPDSFSVFRQKKYAGAGLSAEEREPIPWEREEMVGEIEMKQAINIQALFEADRSQTYLCFLDAVEPKPADPSKNPEEIMVKYRIKANFKSEPASFVAVTEDGETEITLHLPMTTKPAQAPKIVSAGIAQSKYVSDDVYSSTEARKRFLWIELEEPLHNPKDSFFIRMLAYSPDPLLARWDDEMFKAPEEPTLSIEPELIRIIGPDHIDDKSGLNAMTELIKAKDSDVHYLVPLPPGLHPASTELFGFFTYELRVGHKTGWTTAQGRFGKALRTTGVQHPAPQLFCVVTRNEKHIMVTAPFAQTVFNGADVTAKPPRTQLWALLYAQVKRADDKVFRNILLDDRILLRQRRSGGKKGFVMNTDAVQYGITGWKNYEVIKILQLHGLPMNSSLSVLVVELLPTYDKFYSDKGRSLSGKLYSNREPSQINLEEGMDIQRFKSVLSIGMHAAAEKQLQLEEDLSTRMEEQYINEAQKQEILRPLTDHLGAERILRTSTLVAVPPICL